jgi:ABC-type sugar transport system ATPase subunit
MSAAPSAPILALEGVRKSYNVGTPVEAEVLHGIDLAIEAGEFAALVGPSGSGKSTLLNIIGLLERPTAGRVRIAGRESTTLDESGLTALRGRTLGFVFQFHHLIPAFTALENVMMPMLIERGRPTPRCARTPSICSATSGSKRRRARSRPSSRAACSSAWRSRARCRCARRSCSPTNRPGISTRTPRTKSSTCCAGSTARMGSRSWS